MSLETFRYASSQYMLLLLEFETQAEDIRSASRVFGGDCRVNWRDDWKKSLDLLRLDASRLFGVDFDLHLASLESRSSRYS